MHVVVRCHRSRTDTEQPFPRPRKPYYRGQRLVYFAYERRGHIITDSAIRRKILEIEKKRSGATKESLSDSVIDDSGSDNASDRKDDDAGDEQTPLQPYSTRWALF